MKKTLISDNLYLYETTDGRAYYYARFSRNGKRVERSLGRKDTMSIRQAKNRLLELMSADDEPQAARRIPTFAECAVQAISDIERVRAWKKGGKSAAQWLASLQNDAFPALGSVPIDKVSKEDVLAVLSPIWRTKTESARRLQQRFSAVFDWAIVRGYRKDNPGAWKHNLEYFLPQVGKILEVTHHDAPSLDELRQVVKYCCTHPSPVSGCILLCVATVCRIGEAVNAKAEQISADCLVWTVPKDAQKVATEDRRVPLSELGQIAVHMGRDSGYLFSHTGGAHINENSPRLKLIDILKRKTTVHGIRSTFRDWADSQGVRMEVAESCLSHTFTNRVQRAYLRKDFFEERQEVMRQWYKALT